MRIELHPGADAEFAAKVEYYESRQSGLGQRFYREVIGCLDWIVQHPTLPRLRSDHRRVNLKVFPFYVAYAAEGDLVWVLAVAHGTDGLVIGRTERREFEKGIRPFPKRLQLRHRNAAQGVSGAAIHFWSVITSSSAMAAKGFLFTSAVTRTFNQRAWTGAAKETVWRWSVLRQRGRATGPDHCCASLLQ